MTKEPTPSTFAHSPLITPERLKDNHDDALLPAPPWAIVSTSADREAPIDDAAMSVQIEGKHPGSYTFSALSLAVLFELTRFGNSITTNTNKRRGSHEAAYYLKITFRGAAKDNMPVSRIIAGAGPHQIVRTPHDLPRGLHSAGLAVDGGGKPTKHAREVAMRHAERCARAHADADNVQAYLDNLKALFAYHDKLLRIDPL